MKDNFTYLQRYVSEVKVLIRNIIEMSVECITVSVIAEKLNEKENRVKHLTFKTVMAKLYLVFYL